MPRFKVRHEGSAVYLDDMINLTVPKIPGYAVRVTDLAYDPHRSALPAVIVAEANLSSSPSSLKLAKFSANPHAPATRLKMHTNHDVFTLFHAESESFLAASCNPTKSLLPLQIPKSFSSDAFPPPPEMLAGRPLLPPPPTSAPGAHCAYLRPMTAPSPVAEENYAAKNLFVFDRASRQTCGPVGWDSSVRIRHVATDKYLFVSPTPTLVNNKKHYQLCLTPESAAPSLDSMSFKLCPIEIQGQVSPAPPTPSPPPPQKLTPQQHLPATSTTSMRLEHTIANQTLHIKALTKSKFADLAVLERRSHAIFFTSEKADNDAFVLNPHKPYSPYVQSVRRALSFLGPLQRYMERVTSVLPTDKSPTPVRRRDNKFMEALLAQIIFSSDLYFDPVAYQERISHKSYSPGDAETFEDPSSVSFQRTACETKVRPRERSER
jgi:hypothetical protein